jgi:aminoglycoside phosphotransferase (APT) family kinase protein
MRLADGRRLRVLGPLAGGRSHDVFDVLDDAGGRRLVAKIDRRGTGRLDHEYEVLRLLAGSGVPTAAPVVLGRLTRGGYPCLLLEHHAGAAPGDAAGYRRWGADLAWLATVDWRAAGWDAAGRSTRGLGPVDAAGLQRQHLAATSRLRHHLGAMAATVGAVRVPATPVVLTHGDPAPANYLYHAGRGVLIDFELTRPAPWGIDVARAALVLRLTYPEGEWEPALGEFLRGYRTRVSWPLANHWRTWLAVAGVQLLAWRVAARRQPRTPPWQPVIDGLAALLTRPLPC